MNYKFIAFLIACASFGAVFAPRALCAQERDGKPRASELVKLSGEAMRVEQQCLQVIDENRRAIHSTLTFRLRISNVSSRPLIIHRNAPAAFDARLGTSLADMPNRKFRFEQRPVLAHVPPRDFEEAAPTNEFRILQPNESFVYEPQVIIFSGESLGGVFLQLKAATWIWEVEKAEKLRQRWASHGDFFYQDVTAEPFLITISNPEAKIPRCGTQPLK